MGYLAVLSVLAALVSISCANPSPLRSKRQIFREQVLPHSGGKIPEDAFRSDRLALNRLNKEGIAIPDGILLEARHRESHWPSHRVDPDIESSIIKLVLQPDGRYAPPEGRYPFNNIIESTYVIRPPISIHGYGGLPPRKPVQSTLQLPARPFFANDEEVANLNNVDSVDLLNTISQDFPGTRLWTGFGPLFHEHSNRILRQSGAKKLADKPGDSSPANQLLRQPSQFQNKQYHKTNPQSPNVIQFPKAHGQTPAETNESAGVRLPGSSNQNGMDNVVASLMLLQKNHNFEGTGFSQVGTTPKPSSILDIINGIPANQGSNNRISAESTTAQSNSGTVSTSNGGSASTNNAGTRTFQVVNGVLTATNQQAVGKKPGRNVQPLRPGPGHILKTYLTAPSPGYPSLQGIPKTSFVCRKRSGKMESDPQTNCQVFHLCHPDGRKESFICPAGSRYDPKANTCSLWTSVPCPSNS